MRITDSQIRQIIREAAQSDVYRRNRKIADRILAAYSSITDEDVAAMEELGIFKAARNSGGAYDSAFLDEVALNLLDDMTVIKPLFAVFRSGDFIPVEELDRALDGLARRDALLDREHAEGSLKALIKHVRRQHAKLVARSEAAPDAPLGRIAFANDRRGMPPERDTALERRLARALEGHFDGVVLSRENAELIRGLMDQGLYPSMFSGPRAAVLMRGMGVTRSWLARALGRSPEASGSSRVSFTFKPKRGASSWTTSKEVVRDFHDMGAEAQITLYASVADNPGKFLSADRGLYNTSWGGVYSNERESLGLGPIRVFKIDWVLAD